IDSVLYLIFFSSSFMLGCWNVWGLNAPRKRKAIREWISKYRLSLIGLLETKVTSTQLSVVETAINPSAWRFISNVSDSVSCRILVGWDPTVYSVSCLYSSPQWLTCEAPCLIDGSSFVVSFVYDFTSPAGRQDLWDYMRTHYTEFQSRPWVALG